MPNQDQIVKCSSLMDIRGNIFLPSLVGLRTKQGPVKSRFLFFNHNMLPTESIHLHTPPEQKAISVWVLSYSNETSYIELPNPHKLTDTRQLASSLQRRKDILRNSRCSLNILSFEFPNPHKFTYQIGQLA